MANIELTVTVTADDQRVDGAVIKLLDRGKIILTDRGLPERPTQGGEVKFLIFSQKNHTITVLCSPPRGFVIAAGTADRIRVPIARDEKVGWNFKLEKESVSEPWKDEISDIREELLKIDEANKNRFDDLQKSSNAINRTLFNISARGPQDGGGGGGGIVDGAYAKKKVDNAVARVLGRSVGPDPILFLTALRGTFPADPVDGEIAREPVRTYVAMTAESGQLSAAQGTLSREVTLIANEAKTILSTLRSISANTDQERAEALVELIRTDLDALIVEASRIDRPRKRRVNEVLTSLMDGAVGQLKSLREALGLDGEDEIDNLDLVTPVEAQLLAAMKLLRRHVNTLGEAFTDYFADTSSSPDDNSFSGRLAYTALLLSSVGQSTRDLRDALAAVGLSQAECQTTFITDTDIPGGEKISIESILAWIESVADAEGPDMIARSGRLGLKRVLEVVEKHHLPLIGFLIGEAIGPNPPHPGLAQESVLVALNELRSQLAQF